MTLEEDEKRTEFGRGRFYGWGVTVPFLSTALQQQPSLTSLKDVTSRAGLHSPRTSIWRNGQGGVSAFSNLCLGESGLLLLGFVSQVAPRPPPLLPLRLTVLRIPVTFYLICLRDLLHHFLGFCIVCHSTKHSWYFVSRKGPKKSSSPLSFWYRSGERLLNPHPLTPTCGKNKYSKVVDVKRLKVFEGGKLSVCAE